MSFLYFVGDGQEVLAVESQRQDAWETLQRLRNDLSYLDPDSLMVFEYDPCEVAYWDDVGWDWAHPAERAAAETAGYKLPSLDEVLKREGIDPTRPPESMPPQSR